MTAAVVVAGLIVGAAIVAAVELGYSVRRSQRSKR